MKTHITYSLLAAAAACGMAFGAETAYTTPVGYVSLAVGSAGGNAVPANSDVAVSIPLDRTVEFSGTVASVFRKCNYCQRIFLWKFHGGPQHRRTCEWCEKWSTRTDHGKHSNYINDSDPKW